MKTTAKTFYDCNGTPFQVTVLTIGGKKPGPVFTIISGQHGMEHSGPCFLPELAEELDKTDFAGTMHICPCANPGALALDYELYPEHEDLSKINDYYYSPYRHSYSPWGLSRKECPGQKGYNMNRTWNRSGKGLAYDITSWLWKEFVEPAKFTLDIHCAQHRKPFIFNYFEKNNEFAAVTGFPGVNLSLPPADPHNQGNLNFQASNREGHHSLCFEFSVQHGLKEHEYPPGKNAIKNLMIKLGMLDAEPVLPANPVWAFPLREFPDCGAVLKNEHHGHIRYFFDEYDEVKKGDILYEVRDIQTLEVIEQGISPLDGIMHNINILPLASPGRKACNVYMAKQLKPEF